VVLIVFLDITGVCQVGEYLFY